MRLLVLTEDFNGSLLCMTDCNNSQLKSILEKVEENDENGIGVPLTEVCEQLYPNNYMLEIGNTEQSEYADIRELNVEPVAYTNYLTFSVVRSELEVEEGK